MKDVNCVTLMCRLTADPELRSLPSGTSVCKLRVAFSTSRKDASGSWSDRPNYVDVTVWGNQGEACARYLEKGRQVCVFGRLEWREWETKEGGKRQAIDIQAEQVQFVGGGRDDDDRGSSGSGGFTPRSDVPSDGGDFQPVSTPVGGPDSDIPFRWEGSLEYGERREHRSRW
jgi:single-strand DNA-binding protein